MSCAITAGYSIACRDGVGGIDAVYITEFANVTFTEAAGAVTAIAKGTGKRYWKFEIPTKSSATAHSNPVGSVENGSFFYEQGVDFPINKRDATTRNIVATLGKSKCSIITKGKDGVYTLYGKAYGLYLGSSTGMVGAAAGDANGYVLKFEGVELDDIQIVDPAIGAALETPGT